MCVCDSLANLVAAYSGVYFHDAKACEGVLFS